MVKEPVERLKDKILKENLWVFLFKLLAQNDEYAYELRKKVNSEFGFWSGRVTGYRVLYLLEKDKYVISHVEGRRKYYKLTDKGAKQLLKAKDFMGKILASL